MMIQTEDRSGFTSALLSWLVSAVPVILFSITLYFVLEVGSSTQKDWQTSVYFVQKIVITGVLLLVSMQAQFKPQSARRARE